MGVGSSSRGLSYVRSASISQKCLSASGLKVTGKRDEIASRVTTFILGEQKPVSSSAPSAADRKAFTPSESNLRLHTLADVLNSNCYMSTLTGIVFGIGQMCNDAAVLVDGLDEPQLVEKLKWQLEKLAGASQLENFLRRSDLIQMEDLTVRLL